MSLVYSSAHKSDFIHVDAQLADRLFVENYFYFLKHGL